MDIKYTLALVGKPNVGKSSLFNRLSNSFEAVTSNLAGTTRDFKKRQIDILDHSLYLIDTGGLNDDSELASSIQTQALKIAKQANIIIFLADGRIMPDAADKDLFYQLQDLNKPILLAVNKIDNKQLQNQFYEYYSFGSKTILSISVSHNLGIDALKQWIKLECQKLDAVSHSKVSNPKIITQDQSINITIIGRPNVGKSSLLNALLGQQRAIVSDIAGTTIDPVDETLIYKDKALTFIDTVGIRRRSKILGIEKYAFKRSQEIFEKAHIALLVLDASEPLKSQDEKIAGIIDKQLAIIIILNKYDQAYTSYKKLEEEIREKFKFLSFAPIISVSAKTKKSIHKIFDQILTVYQNYCHHIPTSNLNDLVQKAIARHTLPYYKNRQIKIFYASQFRSQPMKIALISNQPKHIHFSYLRYLENQIRQKLPLLGCPIILEPKPKKQNDYKQIEK